MVAMIPTEPTSEIALAVMMIGFVIFLIALAMARVRSEKAPRVAEKTSGGSIAGVIVQMLGFVLVAFGHWRGLILGVPLYWIGTWMRIRYEEKLLREQFGAAYDAYAARVKRFVPGVI